jgi:hypothetical protein
MLFESEFRRMEPSQIWNKIKYYNDEYTVLQRIQNVPQAA